MMFKKYFETYSGIMDSFKLKLLLALTFSQFCYQEAAISHPHGNSKEAEINHYVTKPPSAYAAALNNVGNFNAIEGRIFTCLKPYQNDVLSPIDGVSEFSIAFHIISGAEGTIGLSESGIFNSEGNIGSDGARLSCSGSYETTTGIYLSLIHI